MRTTLRDVAAAAGVSVKTVSNVVNGFEHIRPTTRARVEAAIERLNYRPNRNARSLRNGRTDVIALAVPQLDVPYFAELAGHIVNAAAQRGWTVLIDQTEGAPERERVVAAGIRDQLIDGLIFSPLALAAGDLAARTDDTPLVLLGERISSDEQPLVADHVMIDNVGAARAVTSHLLSLGRQRVAAIGAQRTPAGATARLRQRGYTQAIEAAGRNVDPALVEVAEAYRFADGAAAMARLCELPQPPDAVFCFNDPLALGALRTLYERGLRVPQDVAVAGFDDIEAGRFSVPALTTVRPDKEAIARQAVDLLAQRRTGDAADPPVEVEAPYRLVIRESTAGR